MIIDKFGTAAVRTAWYDSKKVTEHTLEGYTKVIYPVSFIFLVFSKVNGEKYNCSFFIFFIRNKRIKQGIIL